MDAKALVAGTMSERDSRQYLAWVNALRLALRELGVDEAKSEKRRPSPPSSRVTRRPRREEARQHARCAWRRRAAWQGVAGAVVGVVAGVADRRSWASLCSTAERPIFAELTGGREREPCELVEEFHAIVGRRSGKTRAAATLATYLAALVDHSDRLAPGERAVLPLLSATTMASAAMFSSDQGHFR